MDFTNEPLTSNLIIVTPSTSRSSIRLLCNQESSLTVVSFVSCLQVRPRILRDLARRFRRFQLLGLRFDHGLKSETTWPGVKATPANANRDLKYEVNLEGSKASIFWKVRTFFAVFCILLISFSIFRWLCWPPRPRLSYLIPDFSTTFSQVRLMFWHLKSSWKRFLWLCFRSCEKRDSFRCDGFIAKEEEEIWIRGHSSLDCTVSQLFGNHFVFEVKLLCFPSFQGFQFVTDYTTTNVKSSPCQR